MSAKTQRQRAPGQIVSPEETRRLLDEYIMYRFNHALLPADFAMQAGVSSDSVESLRNQRPIPPVDLEKIAHCIDVSTRLLSEIAGYFDMSPATHASLDRFFDAIHRQGQQKKARAA